MRRPPELIASYWTIAGDCYPGGPTEVSPWPLEARVAAAAEAGYRGIGLVHQDIMATAARLGLPAMRRLFQDNGLAHVEVEFLGDWFASGEARAASDRTRAELLEAAEAFGARDLKVAGEMWSDRCDIHMMADAFAELCDAAAAAGTNIAVEVLPMSNIRTLGTATAILREANRPNGGLCVDISHMVRGGIPFSEVARLPAAYFKSVELDDAAADPIGSVWNDTLFHRLYPGEGSFDCPGFLAAVDAAGFEGAYGVEILNQDYRRLALREQAKRSFEGAMAQFNGVAS